MDGGGYYASALTVASQQQKSLTLRTQIRASAIEHRVGTYREADKWCQSGCRRGDATEPWEAARRDHLSKGLHHKRIMQHEDFESIENKLEMNNDE